MPETIAFLSDPAPTAPPPAARSGLWDGDGFGFSDLLDLVNPLQHLPVVSTLYRAITGDTIGAAARIAGGGIFGGPMGMISALGAAALEQKTGRDFGETLLALATGEELSAEALAAIEPVEAPDSAPDAMPPLAEVIRAPYSAPDFGIRLAAANPVEAPDSAPDAMPPLAESAPAPYATPDLGVRMAAADPVEIHDSAPDAMPPLAEEMPAAYARLAAASAVQAMVSPAAPAPPTAPSPTPPGVESAPLHPSPPAARMKGDDSPWAWLPRQAPPAIPAAAAAVTETVPEKSAKAENRETGTPSWFVQAMQGALDRYKTSAGLADAAVPGRTTDVRR